MSNLRPQSPSLAAMRAAKVVSYDGWEAWAVPRLDGVKLHDLREQYIQVRSGAVETSSEPPTLTN